MFVPAAIGAIGKMTTRAARMAGDHVTYWLAAKRVLAGENPYLAPAEYGNWFIYPPAFAVLWAPFTLLSPVVYAAVWGAALGLAWIAARRLIAALLADDGVTLPATVDLLPSVLLAKYLYGAWSWGQVTLLVQVLLLAALLLERRGRPAGAGALLALGGAIKVYPLFLGVAFLSPGRWRAAAWTVAWSLAIALAPMAVVGAPAWIALHRSFATETPRWLDVQAVDQPRPAVVLTLWRAIRWTPGAAMRAAQLAWLAACAAMLVVALRRPRPLREDRLWLALAFTTMAVVSPFAWDNYLALLLFPFAAALHEAGLRSPGDHIRRALLAGVFVPAACFVLPSPWLVGLHASDVLQALGLPLIGLLAHWAALLYAVRATVVAPAKS